MNNNNERGRFAPGQSGNPKGRPPTSASLAAMRARIAQDLDGIVDALVAQAKAGDTNAARLLLERVLPPLRPVELPAHVPMRDGASSTERVRAVESAIHNGEITAEQAEGLLKALKSCGNAMATSALGGGIERLLRKA